MDINQVKKLNIPTNPGSYQFYDKNGELLYIGKAANLRVRVSSYWRESAGHTPAKYSMVKQIAKIKWIETDSEIEALLLEANLIKKHQPPYNVMLRDDKRFMYIKISTGDEIPGVFATRTVDKSGKYYGPFMSADAVRQTLKAIRKIWPYCTERVPKKKPCFYYQINLCTGICGGKISRAEYMKIVIKPMILFFEGKKKSVIKKYEVRSTKLEKEMNNKKTTDTRRMEIEFEIKKLKYQLQNMKQILAHTNVIGVGEKYANDVVELAKILNLKKIPERIEGYDIANIYGQEAVGSMVVFSGGEANKSEYRKFKIKREADASTSSAQAQNDAKPREEKGDDVGMMKEVLERRMKRIREGTQNNAKGREDPLALRALPLGKGEKGTEFWPMPDLIIVDGGKGQLNMASAVLKKYKLTIPVIAISKGEGKRSALAPDKLFFPGEKKPLELSLASPALHLIKRVRDEAHRFAIGYHRNLRGKRFLGRTK